MCWVWNRPMCCNLQSVLDFVLHINRAPHSKVKVPNSCCFGTRESRQRPLSVHGRILCRILRIGLRNLGCISQFPMRKLRIAAFLNSNQGHPRREFPKNLSPLLFQYRHFQLLLSRGLWHRPSGIPGKTQAGSHQGTWRKWPKSSQCPRSHQGLFSIFEGEKVFLKNYTPWIRDCLLGNFQKLNQNPTWFLRVYWSFVIFCLCWGLWLKTFYFENRIADNRPNPGRSRLGQRDNFGRTRCSWPRTKDSSNQRRVENSCFGQLRVQYYRKRLFSCRVERPHLSFINHRENAHRIWISSNFVIRLCC